MKIISTFLQESAQPMIIYCDMDGVICNFMKQFEKLGVGSFDDLQLRGKSSLVWASISKAGISYWADMEWMPDGKELWNFIKPYHPQILSSPTNDKNSKIGKLQWIKKHLGYNIPTHLVPRKEKQNYSKPNHILIDDMEETCREWNNNGGIAIIHKNTKQTISKLKEILP